MGLLVLRHGQLGTAGDRHTASGEGGGLSAVCSAVALLAWRSRFVTSISPGKIAPSENWGARVSVDTSANASMDEVDSGYQWKWCGPYPDVRGRYAVTHVHSGRRAWGGHSALDWHPRIVLLLQFHSHQMVNHCDVMVVTSARCAICNMTGLRREHRISPIIDAKYVSTH